MSLCPELTQEYQSLLEKKRQFDALLETAEIAKTPEEAKSAIASALALKHELMEGKLALENKLFVTVEAAESILGKENVLAAETWEKTYGFRPELPKIPFKRKELEGWKSLNEENEKLPPEEQIHFRLEYDLDKTNEGIPLNIETMAKLAGSNIIQNPDGTTSYRLHNLKFDDNGNIKNKAWFKNKKEAEVINAVTSGRWKIVSDEVLPESWGMNYIDQTNFLIDYWRTKIFPSGILSEEEKTEYEKTFKEWEKNTPKITNTPALTSNPVSQTLRESFVSTVSRTIALEKTQNKKILKDKYNWSNTPSSDGDVVSFGFCKSAGADVGGDDPVGEWSNYGVVFSRMKK